jgi:hypothetical protein
MYPISPNYLYAAMMIAVVLFSLYLGSRDQPNPYDNRTVLKDAKAGNFWARMCVAYSFLIGIFMIAFFSCFF